ncbi:MAG TPA: hypothetical protein VGH74_15600 [Planctomycetaceae bacterium]
MLTIQFRKAILTEPKKVRDMVDPDALNKFDASLATLKNSADKAAESNAAATTADADAKAKASTAAADLATLQAALDNANAAGVAVGLKVNVPQ